MRVGHLDVKMEVHVKQTTAKPAANALADSLAPNVTEVRVQYISILHISLINQLKSFNRIMLNSI